MEGIPPCAVGLQGAFVAPWFHDILLISRYVGSLATAKKIEMISRPRYGMVVIQ